MAASAQELNTAEVAYAAINEVTMTKKKLIKLTLCPPPPFLHYRLIRFNISHTCVNSPRAKGKVLGLHYFVVNLSRRK